MRVIARSAGDTHAKAVDFVIRSRGKVAKEEYDRLLGLLDDSKDAREAARDALDKHKKEHGC